MKQWTAEDIPDQSERKAVITGAGSGLGFETALALARKGAHVILAGRTVKKLMVARDRILAAWPEAALTVLTLDLASLASVRTFAASYRANYDRLDLLINNAGVMALPRQETADGFEMQMGTNHLGHFALTGLLMETLLSTPGSRVVNVSSMGHRGARGIRFNDINSERSYSRYGAYFQSKLANMLFTLELRNRLKAAGADVLSTAAHPGSANTHLADQAVQHSLGDRLLYALAARMMHSAALGALPQLYAATAPDVQSGDFYRPDGHFGFLGYPRRAAPSGPARDEKAARHLWELSCELTGVQFRALERPA